MMRIAQIILPDASQYERKAARADRSALAGRYEVVDDVRNADIAHVYTSRELTAGLDVPYLSSMPLKQSRWPWRKAKEPGVVATWETLREAVEEEYFRAQGAGRGAQENSVKLAGSFARPGVENMVQQTLARIHRFRDDVRWKTFAAPPTPEDLASVDVWADPAIANDDLDGFVAEALVLGLPVVAARTPINSARLEQGRTGWLVPPRDPNEMTHAILAALFKPEVAQGKIQAARQTVSKFRSRQRLRVLTHMYETLIR